MRQDRTLDMSQDPSFWDDTTPLSFESLTDADVDALVQIHGPMSLAQIASIVGLSIERVRAIEESALAKFRRKMEQIGVDSGVVMEGREGVEVWPPTPKADPVEAVSDDEDMPIVVRSPLERMEFNAPALKVDLGDDKYRSDDQPPSLRTKTWEPPTRAVGMELVGFPEGVFYRFDIRRDKHRAFWVSPAPGSLEADSVPELLSRVLAIRS